MSEELFTTHEPSQYLLDINPERTLIGTKTLIDHGSQGHVFSKSVGVADPGLEVILHPEFGKVYWFNQDASFVSDKKLNIVGKKALIRLTYAPANIAWQKWIGTGDYPSEGSRTGWILNQGTSAYSYLHLYSTPGNARCQLNPSSWPGDSELTVLEIEFDDQRGVIFRNLNTGVQAINSAFTPNAESGLWIGGRWTVAPTAYAKGYLKRLTVELL